MRYNDEQISVLQIVLQDHSTSYYNSQYGLVSDPYSANRYFPLDAEVPSRQLDRERDMKYLQSCAEGEVSFISFSDAKKQYDLSTSETID